jgi:hypothetical protein
VGLPFDGADHRSHWGGVRDLMLPGELKRAFAQTVTAQKEGLASLQRARGETASLRSLANAARLMQDHPGLPAPSRSGHRVLKRQYHSAGTT